MIPKNSAGSPIHWRSHPSVTCSSSVSAGQLFHSMPLTLSAGRQHLGENARVRGRDGEVGEKARMIPMRQRGNDGALEILEDRVHRFAVIGRVRGQAIHQVARLHVRQHRILPDVFQIVRRSSPPPGGRNAGILRCPLSLGYLDRSACLC